MNDGITPEANLCSEDACSDYRVELEDKIHELRDQLSEARKFGEEAVAKHNELLASQRVLRCAFCNADYPEETSATQHERIIEHVKVCHKHPMREVEERLVIAIRWLRRIETQYPNSLGNGAIDKHLEGKPEL